MRKRPRNATFTLGVRVLLSRSGRKTLVDGGGIGTVVRLLASPESGFSSRSDMLKSTFFLLTKQVVCTPLAAVY